MGKLSLIGNDDKMWQKAFCIINLYFFLSVFPISFVPIQAGTSLKPRRICEKIPGFYSQKLKFIKNSKA